MNRRVWISGCSSLLGTASALEASAFGQDMTVLDVAYAGSMGSMMEGPVKAGVARALQVEMHGRAAGSDALAHLIVGESIAADVFISVTPGPMKIVLASGKALQAVPIARTEMVIAYSPKSAFAGDFAGAAAHKRGTAPWYEILARPGIRFGRTDPATDPQGRNILFTFELAESFYKQPGLTEKILGETINPAQIFGEPTVEARLQSGELDAASAYKIQPGPFGLPYLGLPDEINLGDQSLRERYQQVSLDVNGKTYRPEPLVYFAAVISSSKHPEKSAAFVKWLTSDDGREVFRKYAYDLPAGASALRA